MSGQSKRNRSGEDLLAPKLSLALVLLCALCLAGCSTGSGLNITKQYRGVGKVADEPSFDGTTHSVVYWLDEDRKAVSLTTWGSGSCPSVPTGLDVASTTKVELAFKNESGPCTSDLAPYTTEFAVPAGLSRKRPVVVFLDVPERNNPEEITIGVSPVQGPAVR